MPKTSGGRLNDPRRSRAVYCMYDADAPLGENARNARDKWDPGFFRVPGFLPYLEIIRASTTIYCVFFKKALDKPIYV